MNIDKKQAFLTTLGVGLILLCTLVMTVITLVGAAGALPEWLTTGLGA